MLLWAHLFYFLPDRAVLKLPAPPPKVIQCPHMLWQLQFFRPEGWHGCFWFFSWNVWQRNAISSVESDGVVEYSLFHFSFIQNRQKSIPAYLKNKVTCSTGGEKKDLRFHVIILNNDKSRDGAEPLVIAVWGFLFCFLCGEEKNSDLQTFLFQLRR